MGNFKVRVNSEAESKEAQELFFQLGYGFEGNTLKETQEFEYTGVFHLFAYGDDQDLTHSSDRELFNSKMHKEVILPELRAMVSDQYAEIEQVRQASKDNVNNPQHYNKGGVECIDAIEASMTHEAFKGYLKGNVQKYMWRYEQKGGVESLRKAQWYLERLVASMDS